MFFLEIFFAESRSACERQRLCKPLVTCARVIAHLVNKKQTFFAKFEKNNFVSGVRPWNSLQLQLAVTAAAGLAEKQQEETLSGFHMLVCVYQTYWLARKVARCDHELLIKPWTSLLHEPPTTWKLCIASMRLLTCMLSVQKRTFFQCEFHYEKLEVLAVVLKSLKNSSKISSLTLGLFVVYYFFRYVEQQASCTKKTLFAKFTIRTY